MKHILLIEDNAEMRENIAEILTLADYNVTTAANGKEGAEQAKVIKPDLIICDIMMPELDGYGVLRILAKNPETVGIPFIFLTAKAERSDLRKGMNLGADDYITKPFEEADLLEAVETRLRRSDILKKEFSADGAGLSSFLEEARGLEGLKNLPADRKTQSYRKKEAIYREGDYANYLYFIEKGRVKSSKMDDYGKEIVTEICGRGDFIGYMALLEGDEHRETASAMEDTEVSVIPKQDFLDLLQKNRDVAIRFIRMLAGNVHEKEERLLRLAYAPVRERVADALLKLQRKNAANGPAAVNITREDLAGLVGTATESLIRTLSDFREEGLVEISGREIRIVNETGMKQACGN